MDSSAGWKHTVRDVPVSPAGFTCDRIELRVQALELATRGWPIIPGTYLRSGEWASGPEAPVRNHSGAGFVPERPEPVQQDWQERVASDSVAELVSWWAERPHSLLVATDNTMKAIEVDAELGRRTAQYLRGIGVLVPIIATPLGEWYFLTDGKTTDGNAARATPRRHDEDPEKRVEGRAAEQGRRVRTHGAGSWVPLPPTMFPSGSVHWRVKPELCGWRLPCTEFVRSALCAVLSPPTPARADMTTERRLDVANLLTVGR